MRLSRTFASSAARLSAVAKNVPMSPLESGKFVNYQRIQDNLEIVKDRLGL
jgi:aconitate hydratase